jgi:tetratricopeptide (TPR) repeat protein
MLVPGFKSFAQTVYSDQVRVDNPSINRNKDNNVTVAMDVVLLKNMKVTSNRAAILTPVIEAKGYNKALPSILVYGRRRQIYDQRNNTTPKEAFTSVRRKSNTEQTVKYLVQVPYEKWMSKSDLKMVCDLCGCGDANLSNTTDPITPINIVPEKPKPEVVYVVPNPEPVKVRSITGQAFLDFPVNKTVISPNYRRNQSELAKIRATIDTIRNDKNITITGITIDGYASPEGSYSNNARLAKGRTQALLNYVRNYYQFPANVMHMSSTPEDWVGFRRMVAASHLGSKDKILSIIDDNETDLDVKERHIARSIPAQDYRYIIDHIYIALRHSDYKVTYSVRGFNNDESRVVIKKHPQQLSLQEIYNLAHTYKAGSEEYNNCFKVAAVMFPDDPTSNLNAAAMELEKGDVASAKQHLAKADINNPATQNNLGVVALFEGRYDEAETYFTHAKALGQSIAEKNLAEVSRMRAFPIDNITENK